MTEVFLIRGKNVLRLTNFHRVDTAWPLQLGNRIAFVASDNVTLGRNPDEISQLFSIGLLGDHLRQLTKFRATSPP